MKKNKKIIDFSKRKFNIYLLFSFLFLSLPKKNINLKNNPVKKIRYNNFVWHLNEKD
tara:strand:+ start:290 stop:460 length:171 start_codon:yes stop_codon:yes gene_type:complete